MTPEPSSAGARRRVAQAGPLVLAGLLAVLLWRAAVPPGIAREGANIRRLGD